LTKITFLIKKIYNYFEKIMFWCLPVFLMSFNSIFIVVQLSSLWFLICLQSFKLVVILSNNLWLVDLHSSSGFSSISSRLSPMFPRYWCVPSEKKTYSEFLYIYLHNSNQNKRCPIKNYKRNKNNQQFLWKNNNNINNVLVLTCIFHVIQFNI